MEKSLAHLQLIGDGRQKVFKGNFVDLDLQSKMNAIVRFTSNALRKSQVCNLHTTVQCITYSPIWYKIFILRQMCKNVGVQCLAYVTFSDHNGTTAKYSSR